LRFSTDAWWFTFDSLALFLVKEMLAIWIMVATISISEFCGEIFKFFVVFVVVRFDVGAATRKIAGITKSTAIAKRQISFVMRL
jgi:hypothetical protein